MVIVALVGGVVLPLLLKETWAGVAFLAILAVAAVARVWWLRQRRPADTGDSSPAV
ncbi:MAG: hypothetical protein ACRD0R_22440 [Acidimicrobiales bacterium]